RSPFPSARLCCPSPLLSPQWPDGSRRLSHRGEALRGLYLVQSACRQTNTSPKRERGTCSGPSLALRACESSLVAGRVGVPPLGGKEPAKAGTPTRPAQVDDSLVGARRLRGLHLPPLADGRLDELLGLGGVAGPHVRAVPVEPADLPLLLLLVLAGDLDLGFL